MKLTSVHIREYKSIQDSTPFEVGDVTCLVGKNEAGKTAVLEALNRLNPLVGTKAFDVTEDYPRAKVEEYQQQIEQKKRNGHLAWLSDLLAEGEGFEPPVPFQAQRFSRPPVSTTHASLRMDDQAAILHIMTPARVGRGDTR
jgi:ABC-type iron transport system FetAB ATPase subunit